jgi:uncharacterized protein YtpQ (UPF0354 family)
VLSFDRSLVVPVVKAVVGEIEGGEVIELPPDNSPISIPLVAELIVMYALDYPDRFEFITRRHLQENGLNQEELHALALSNLPNRVPKIELHGEFPRYMITAGGNFEATLLLLDGLWDQLTEHLPGKPMAVVPARDLLFVSGSDYEGASQFLADVASKELEEKRYALSKCILVREGGKWHAYRTAS